MLCTVVRDVQDARRLFDSLHADAEVGMVVERLVSDVCELAWAERVHGMAACVSACQQHLRQVALEREADQLARVNTSIEAEDVRLRLELELWEVAKQLDDKKRCVPRGDVVQRCTRRHPALIFVGIQHDVRRVHRRAPVVLSAP